MRLKFVIDLITTLAGFASALFITSCAAKTNSSTVRMAFPDWSQLQAQTYAKQSELTTPTASAAAAPQIISINTSLNGGPTKAVFSWLRVADSDVAPLAPPTFVVEKGSLIQVLVVFSGSGATRFYYGDTPLALTSPDDVNLDLTLTNVAATQSASEGNVVGRYLTGPNSGPTGTFQYRYQPDSRPSMIVTTGEVFSGWMNTFGLSNSMIQYTWPDGTVAFSFNAEDNSLLSKASVSPARSARLEVPAGFENDSTTASGYNMQSRPRKLLTVGFFGPFADTAYALSPVTLCLSTPSSVSSASLIPNLYATASLTDSTAAPSDQMVWLGKLTPDTNFAKEVRVVDPDLAVGTTYVQGGDDSGTCGSTGTPYVDYLKLDPAQIKSSDSILGFHGPFAALASGNYLSTAYSGSSLTVSWNYLPGVTANLGGVSLFWRRNSGTGSTDTDLKTNDGYACGAFRGLALNEVKVGVGTTTATINGLTSSADADSLQIIACPRALDGTFFKSAVTRQSLSGSTVLAAVRLSATDVFGFAPTTSTTPSLMQTSVCSPILVSALDTNGNLGSTAGGTVTLTSSDSSDQFSSDSSCSNASVSLILTNFYNPRFVWMKTARSSGTAALSLTSSSGLTAASFYYQAGPVLSVNRIVTVMPSSIWAYSCNEGLFVAVDASGAPANMGGHNLTPSTVPSFVTYAASDVSCAGSAATSFYVSGTSSTLAHFAYNAASLTSLNAAPSADAGGATVVAKNVAVLLPGLASRVSFMAPSTFDAGTCQSVLATSTDSNGALAPVSAATSVTFAISNGQFYSASDCASGSVISAPTATIGAGSVRASAANYVRATSAGTAVVTVMSSGSSSSSSQTLTVTAPDTTNLAQTVSVSAPGETLSYTNGNLTGSPASLAPSYSYHFVFFALTADHRIANGMTSSVAYNESRTVTILTPGVKFASTGTQTQNITFNSGTTSQVDLAFDPTLDGQNVNVSMSLSTSSVYGMANSVSPKTIPVSSIASFSVKIYGSQHVVTSACQPILVTYEDPSGTARVTNATALVSGGILNNGSVTTGYMGFGVSQSSCPISGSSWGYSSSVGSFYEIDYFKFSSAVSGTMGSFMFGSDVYYPGQLSGIAVTSGSIGTATSAMIYGSTSPKSGVCTPYLITTEDSSGSSAATPSDVTMTLSATGGGATALYSDQNCTSTATTFTIPNANRAAVIFFKTSGSGSASIAIANGSGLTGHSIAPSVRP